MSAGTFGFERLNSYLGQMKGRLDGAMQGSLVDATLMVEGKVKSILATGRAEWVPLAASTVRARERRRSKMHPANQPLNETGHMMRTVTHEIGEDVAIVGSVVEYDPVHEFGTTKAGRSRNVKIPARPHYGPAVEEAMPGIKATFLKRVEQAGRK